MKNNTEMIFPEKQKTNCISPTEMHKMKRENLNYEQKIENKN